MSEKDIYTQLQERVIFMGGGTESKRFRAILEEMFTPEEGRICLELIEPVTCPELAIRLNMDEKSLQAKLNNLVDRGYLNRGKTQYGFPRGFHHDVVGDTGVHTGPHAISQKVKDLWADYFYNEVTENFINRRPMQMSSTTGGTKRRANIVWPAIGALELSPNIRPEQILPEENFKLVIEKAERRILAPCGCRISWNPRCNYPLMT